MHRGVELYRGAADAKEAGRRRRPRAAGGLLRAVEHLAMAGLYAAREKLLLHVPAPSAEATKRRMAEVLARLKRLHPTAENYGEHLCLTAVELL